MTENNRYFAYCRESIDLKTGIEIQKEKINKYCQYKGIIISKWFVDNDASAFKFRPNYDKMMKELQSSPLIKGLICTSLMRFGRSTEQVLIDYKTIVRDGKDIIFVDNNIESNTTNGKAMLGMLAVFAEWERDTIRERLQGGREFAKRTKTKSGLPMHRPPIEIDWKEFDEYKKFEASTSFIQKKMVDKRTGKKISKSAFYKAVKNRETTINNKGIKNGS